MRYARLAAIALLLSVSFVEAPVLASAAAKPSQTCVSAVLIYPRGTADSVGTYPVADACHGKAPLANLQVYLPHATCNGGSGFVSGGFIGWSGLRVSHISFRYRLSLTQLTMNGVVTDGYLAGQPFHASYLVTGPPCVTAAILQPPPNAYGVFSA